MKFLISIIFYFLISYTFSQEKNCNSVVINGGSGSRCEFEIWKEKSDTLFCILKNQNEECNTYNKFDGKLNKTWIFYAKDSINIYEKFTMKNGVMINEHIKYYTNGQLNEKAFYINGNLDGKNFKYFKNGQIEEYGEYKNGKVNGPLISYYENGFIRWTSNYCDDHSVDVSYKYWDNLKLASVTFQMDKLGYWEEKIINMYFDPNGNAISEFEFKEMWNCN